jgi:2-methylcitrate dehydratase PrpD
MPYTIALALTFGNLHDEHLDERDVLERADIRRLVSRVTPKIDDTLSNTNPNRLPGTIEIRTTDGRTSLFEGAGHVSSGTEFRKAVLEKYAMNAAGVDPRVSEQVIELATRIEQQPSIASFMSLLRF